MLPVKTDLISIIQTLVAGNRRFIGDDNHPLQFQDVRYRQPVVLRVQQLAPERSTALAEPGIQFLEGVEHAVLSVQPDAPSAVLDVLFNDAFSQTEATLQKSGSNR